MKQTYVMAIGAFSIAVLFCTILFAFTSKPSKPSFTTMARMYTIPSEATVQALNRGETVRRVVHVEEIAPYYIKGDILQRGTSWYVIDSVFQVQEY